MIGWITLILLIIIAVVVFKLVKSAAKAIFIVTSLISLIIIIGVFVVMADTKDFRENFPTQHSLYLLEDDDELLAGVAFIQREDSQPMFTTEKELVSFQDSFEKDDLDQIIGDNYKLFTISLDAFDEVEVIDGGEIDMTRKQVMDMINSDTPMDDFIELQAEDASEELKDMFKEQLKEQAKVNSDTEFKGMLLMTLYGAAVDKQGPTFLFREYKQGNVAVYKETILFKIIDTAPSFLLDSILKIEEGE